MAVETNEYLSHLCRSMAGLVNEIVGERSIPLFRRAPQVLLSAPSVTSPDYHLTVTRRELVDDDAGGTFTSSTPDAPERVLVFRHPARMRVSFLLVSPGVAPDARLAAYDKLTTWFFDHRTLPPFLPGRLDRYPALIERLRSGRAELRMTEPPAEAQWLNRSTNGFSFAFDYSALYHSGNPLREEQRVQTRTIHFPTEARERSHP